MVWRLLVVVFTLAVLGAVRAQADLIYVLNSADATISVLDAASHEEQLRIPVLREPHHLVLSPDGAHLLVADSGGNELFFLNPDSGDVERRVSISNPYHLEFSPDGRFLVVASLRRGQVDVLDGRTLELVQRFRPGSKPSHVAFSPDSRMAYVTIQGDRSVAAFDLTSMTQAWKQEVGPEPAGIIWHRGRLIVGIMGSENFVTLDPETKAVAKAFTLGRGAHTIFPSPDGRALYATSRVDSRVAEVDPDTLAVRRVWAIPGGPDCMTFAPDGRIWMTLRWNRSIAILDPTQDGWETARVGRSPHGIFYRASAAGAAFAQAPPAVVPMPTATSVPAPTSVPAAVALPMTVASARPLHAPLPGRPGLAPPAPVGIVPGPIPRTPVLPAAQPRTR